MTTMASRAQTFLPDSAFYRAIAATFRLWTERRLLFLDDLVSNGCTAVDVGAWWGPWTYWLSRRASSVWSFEPNPDMASFLARVGSANIHVENVALSDRRGSGTLFVPRGVGRDALATLSATHRVSDARRFDVPLRRLDEYVLDDVQFVKIDVEGHEFEVLKGAEQTLARCSPTILIEVEQAFHDEPIQLIFDWLLARGYEGRIRRNREWAPLSTFDVRKDQRSHDNVKGLAYINNFVFTPRRVERAGQAGGDRVDHDQQVEGRE